MPLAERELSLFYRSSAARLAIRLAASCARDLGVFSAFPLFSQLRSVRYKFV